MTEPARNRNYEANIVRYEERIAGTVGSIQSNPSHLFNRGTSLLSTYLTFLWSGKNNKARRLLTKTVVRKFQDCNVRTYVRSRWGKWVHVSQLQAMF